jgi:SEC-C motif-containing protein
VSCPCGSGKPLEECCGVYIRGEARPETAEALMRARYTAYATGEVDYVLSTHDPERNGEVDRSSTELWSKKSEWLGLEILNTQGGGPLDDSGTVEFVARYKIRGTTVTHRERGTFRRHNGNWVFVDGEQVSGPPVVREGPRIGRNHPCPCGSGKKYKKCCGAGGGSAVVRAGQS